jgi:hypothetical protein
LRQTGPRNAERNVSTSLVSMRGRSAEALPSKLVISSLLWMSDGALPRFFPWSRPRPEHRLNRRDGIFKR